MIYTVTLNPSLDYIVAVDDFKPEHTNRTKSEKILPGGKGINVSLVLHNLGFHSRALGYIAGFTGEEILRLMNKTGVEADFIKLEQGNSRINVKFKASETEINGRGPDIGQATFEKILEKLDVLGEGDVLFLSGSIPHSMPEDCYGRICERLQGRGVEIVVDATKDSLLKVLRYQPFLIKPNLYELGEIFGVELKNREEVIPYGRKLQEMGARNVLISLASQGAVLIAESGQIMEASAPEGELMNAVGAGDSMVAGFVAGWMEQKDYEHAFKLGLAAGSASAFSEELATKEGILQLYGAVCLL